MTTAGDYGDVNVSVEDDFVATVEIRRPPNNFFESEPSLVPKQPPVLFSTRSTA